MKQGTKAAAARGRRAEAMRATHPPRVEVIGRHPANLLLMMTVRPAVLCAVRCSHELGVLKITCFKLKQVFLF